MAEFNGTTLTNKGRDLISKLIAGENLTFTKLMIGDGDIADSADQKTLTKLVSAKKTLSIMNVEDLQDGTMRVRGSYTNKGLSSGFFVREIGLFAKGNDGVEVLYCYTNAGDTADFIPGEGKNIIENIIDIITIVAQAENVTAVISDSIEYITRKDIATATEVEMGGTDKVVTVDALHDYVDNFAWPLNQVNSRYSVDTDHARYTISWDAGGENNLLVPYASNKVVMEEAGKFIHNNTTYGGTRGELNQVTIDLIEKIYSINKRDKRYGTEFFITKTTQGDGETAPLSVAENNNTYYRTFYRNKNNSTPYSRAFWIKAEEENTVLIIAKGKTYIDGERITKHTVLQDTNWHFVIFNHQNTLGYDYNNLVYMMKGKSCYTALEYVGASYLPPTAVLSAPTSSISDGIHEYVDKFVWPMNRVDGRNCKQVYGRYADEWEAGTSRHLYKARNGGTFEEAGKFIDSNTTYGGTRGELNQVTVDLVETCGHRKVNGKEFYITKYTQGSGTAYPIELNGQTYYLSGDSTSTGFNIIGEKWFVAYWLKAEEANTVLLYPGMYVDGEKMTTYTVLEDTNWHFILLNSSTTNGYTTSSPFLYTKPGKSFYTAMEYAGSGWLPTRTRLKVPAVSIYDNNTVDVGLNKSTNGYMKLANGLIYQWGKTILQGGIQNIINYNITFPNKATYINTSIYPHAAQSDVEIINSYLLNNSQFVAYHYGILEVVNNSGYSESDAEIIWFAIGY